MDHLPDLATCAKARGRIIVNFMPIPSAKRLSTFAEQANSSMFAEPSADNRWIQKLYAWCQRGATKGCANLEPGMG
jgi:hypothetical protein